MIHLIKKDVLFLLDLKTLVSSIIKKAFFFMGPSLHFSQSLFFLDKLSLNFSFLLLLSKESLLTLSSSYKSNKNYLSIILHETSVLFLFFFLSICSVSCPWSLSFVLFSICYYTLLPFILNDFSRAFSFSSYSFSFSISYLNLFYLDLAILS